MARGWFNQRWWWLLVATFTGMSFLAAADWISYPSGKDSPGYVSGNKVLVYLRQQCERDINLGEIRDFLSHYESHFTVEVIPKTVTCESRSRGLGGLVQALGQTSTRALIAALDVNTCDVAARLAHLWDKPLLTWTCPLKSVEERELSSIVRLSPSLPAMAEALTQIFLHFKWKSVAVIGTDHEPWSSLDRAVVGALRSIGVLPRHHMVLPSRATVKQIHTSLRPLHTIPCRVLVLCLPSDAEFSSRVLAELDVMRESHVPTSAIVMVHPKTPELFQPRQTPISSFTNTTSNVTATVQPTLSSTLSSNFSNPDASHGARAGSESHPWAKDRKDPGRFSPSRNLSQSTLHNLLVLAPFDRRCNFDRLLNCTESFVEMKIVDHLRECLDTLIRDNSSINSYNNKMYAYALLDWHDEEWRAILTVTERDQELLVQELTANDFTDEEVFGSHCDDENDCSEDDAIPIRTAHIVAIILGSLLFALIAIVTAALIRRHLLKKRMSKGPYKIILTASDFVFPQVPDSRRVSIFRYSPEVTIVARERGVSIFTLQPNDIDEEVLALKSKKVDEGIEAMLCCWLQQLQEFGGPEVDKPDLLQGSVGSLRPHLQASTGSLARHTILKDPRARYNGDLVQLKELPCQSTFELKNKAMDVLVTIHGLRHENLNPLIGCLTEPTRPCLVSENCSRGSLEDVLVQDEIKLDWSFRLSLLTDLVRGMKYLHSSPIRVHGYLTSRNCVIDARWVLKVTDYGLPAFYEAQNIVPPAKTARDLLWTAPELLRHSGLRKKGTQAGDVYSFGIVMQEVVVRGEPFCMLALSPEDIIEKVKKPPPLIRPSVSKGAAPPEAINIMRQCWAEAADMRPDFTAVHDLFKKLNHGRKVNFVDTMFQMLEKYSNNLEELIRERTEQLDMEKKKTEQLLNRMLPSSVAEKLKFGMPVDPEEFREVTIYFSDIVGFTTISAYSTPFQVVDLLNDLYTCFDATINAYTVYKVETIGDAYMVVGGCPVRIPDHASQIATMALDLLHQSGKFKLRHLPNTQLRLRIGLHTGPCCAGVVGLTMPRYCLFGDTVNTASRMESTGAPWRIHLSQATRDRLNQVGGYHIEYRGRTEVKGKGKMPTYWLLGKQGFDKELPTPPVLGLDESLIIGSLPNNDPSESGTPQLPVPTSEDNSSGECSASFATTSGGHASPSGIKIISSEHSFNSATKKVAVSVHDEKVLTASFSLKSGEPVEILRDIVKTPEYTGATVTKSTSGDTQISLGTPVSATEVAAALLGASTSSLTSMTTGSTFRGRHRRVGVIDEDDLSTPYNHYRCLSPNEHYGKGTGCRLLKRQFSLDRADDPPILPDPPSQRGTPRLYKQNSAGAANDLERIEEVPSTPGPQCYRHAASMSLSVDSTTLSGYLPSAAEYHVYDGNLPPYTTSRNTNSFIADIHLEE